MATAAAQNRFYRQWGTAAGLRRFRVVVKETDLQIYCNDDLTDLAREMVLQYRGFIERFARRYPLFLESLVPITVDRSVPPIVSDMMQAAAKVGVGPMAAVAGAIAAHVGRDLLTHTPQVIVENGGDIFVKTNGPLVMGIYAGSSPLSLRLGLRLDPNKMPLGICTSSGSVGHSLSMGSSDAVCITSSDCALADASATAVGNLVRTPADIARAIEYGRSIGGVTGMVIIIGDRMGCWGDITLEPLKPKKG
jgi:ApbE superfamily uncharacterized protein (UPF0280 family)